LAVLKQKPLLKGEQGPTITITAEDIAIYQKYAAVNGSLVPVEVGERLTQYQALQAMLLPSANNMADLLARWAFGSEADYVNFANSFVKSLGLKNTTVADASGFSPKTTSTAHDLMLLGENIMDNPVLAEIVGQAKATIPVAGEITNSNLLLGYQDIVGIKTGNTDEAGSCYLFAAKHQVAPGHVVTIIGITMGATDRVTALDESLKLLQSSYKNFVLTKAVNKGQVVGSYQAPWGGTVSAMAAEDVVGINWKSQAPKIVSDLRPINSTATHVEGDVGAIFGRRKISTPLVLDSTLPPADIKWRAKRLLFLGKIL
jgi:D-alanyl-D-alanine carboxypeptidase (penicillin-binding protein 5/6)